MTRMSTCGRAPGAASLVAAFPIAGALAAAALIAPVLGCGAAREALEEAVANFGLGQPAAPRARDDGTTVLFDGKTLAGWQKAVGVDYEGSGEITVEDGAVLIHAGDPGSGIRWTGEFPGGEFEVELEGKRFAGDDFFCGMTFPVKGAHATLILGGWGGGVVGISNVDYYAASDNETTGYVEFEKDRWYGIRLRLARGRIDFWLDGKHMIEQKLEGHSFEVWPQQEPARPFGITTWYTGGALRDITVRRVAPVDE